MTTDVQIEQTIRGVIAPLMALDTALTGVGLLRMNQPRQQGTPSTPTVFFVKVTERNWGSPKRGQVWDDGRGKFVTSLLQACAATYQFMALVPQDPSNEDQPTESDVLQQFRAIMQTDEVLDAFRAQGISIERIADVRNPYFTDDRDQFEANPSFDVALTYSRNYAGTIPAVSTFDSNVSRV
jgi:hypothetical protein